MKTSCTDFIRAVRERRPATRELRLNFDGIAVLVASNSQDLNAMLEAYFCEFVAAPGDNFTPDFVITAHEGTVPDIGEAFTEKAPDPGKTKVKEEYINCGDGRLVRKRLTGMLFAFTPAEHLAVGECARNCNQIINFINSRLIARHLDRGCYLGHAAAVAFRGKGIALCGFSGMGKSTLALFLMNEGCVFVSNDRVLLSGDLPARLYGVPKQPRINPGTALHNDALRNIVDSEDRERFAALPPERLWSLEHKYDALIGECWGPGRFALRAPFSGLAALNWRREGGTTRFAEVYPPDRLDLVRAFSKDSGLFFAPDASEVRPAPSLEAYAVRLAQAPMLEITGGVDFAAAAAACLEFFCGGQREQPCR
ncbi:MAG: HprK-related kinase B [Desulfovibrio sp.]|jgi:HprK-related kinase B|nr:HprK-related kinase B [Desulfovibrio sp.]